MSGFRPFAAADAPALVELYSLVQPDDPISEAFVRHFNATHREEFLLNQLWLEDGRLVGAAWALRDGDLARPAVLTMLLAPDAASPVRCEALYRHALARLPAGVSALVTRVREDDAPWRELLAREGYRELERQWESVLTVTGFDETPFASAFDKARAAGVAFGTLADLPADETTQRRLYRAITEELLPEVPFAEPLAIWPFEVWRERAWRDPNMNPESWFLAFAGDEIAGMSELRRTADPARLATGLTAVRRDCRRRGVAMSLKLLGIRYAREHGAAQIVTMNHSVNRPMLAINEALGFVKRPVWVRFKKILEAPHEDPRS